MAKYRVARWMTGLMVYEVEAESEAEAIGEVLGSEIGTGKPTPNAIKSVGEVFAICPDMKRDLPVSWLKPETRQELIERGVIREDEKVVPSLACIGWDRELEDVDQAKGGDA